MRADALAGANYIVAGLAVTLAVWLALSAAVIVNRLRYDRGARRLLALTSRYERATPGSPRASDIDRLLSRMSRREVYRLIADPTLSPGLTPLVVGYAQERWGLERIQRDALPPPHGGRRKWRRVSALFALGEIRATGVHDLLASALDDRDPDVVGAAVVVLHRLADRRAAEILIDALVRKSHSPSRIATQLDQFALPIADVLRPVLRSSHEHARFWAVSLLHRYPDADGLAREIAALARDSHPPVRKAVLETLATMSPAEAVGVATQLAGDSVGYVRARAVRTFATPNGGLTYIMRAARARRIAPLLADAEWDVRLAAKDALVSLGTPAWREVSPFLDSPDRFARNGAAEVLQNLGLLDRLLEDAARGEENGGDGALRVLERAFREGGPGMIDAVVARSSDAPPPGVATLLARLGFVGSTALSQ